MYCKQHLAMHHSLDLELKFSLGSGGNDECYPNSSTALCINPSFDSCLDSQQACGKPDIIIHFYLIELAEKNPIYISMINEERQAHKNLGEAYLSLKSRKTCPCN